MNFIGSHTFSSILAAVMQQSARSLHGNQAALQAIYVLAAVLCPHLFVCLFDLILYVPSTIFQLYRDVSSWVEPVLS